MLKLHSRVKCGLTLPGLGREATLREAQRAEALGFDSLWGTDHLAFHVPIADPLTLLAFVAGVTQRITLGTSIYLLPLRHPAVTAKQAAGVDLLSGGRLVLGVGIGGEYPPEFELVGVPPEERGARVDEAIPLLRRLWGEPRVAHAGRFFRFGEVMLEPKPARAGGPPIWVGGRSPAALRRAGALGDGYISHMASPERFRSNLETASEAAARAGREPGVFATAAYLFALLDDAPERARQRASEALGRIYGRAFPESALDYCLLGPEQAWLEKIGRYVEAGCRHVIVAPLDDPAAHAERVAERILPQIRSLRP